MSGHEHDPRVAAFGGFLRAERRSRKMSQTALAQRARITHEEISRIERGHAVGVRLSTILRILSALDLTDRPIASLFPENAPSATKDES